MIEISKTAFENVMKDMNMLANKYKINFFEDDDEQKTQLEILNEA